MITTKTNIFSVSEGPPEAMGSSLHCGSIFSYICKHSYFDFTVHQICLDNVYHKMIEHKTTTKLLISKTGTFVLAFKFKKLHRYGDGILMAP